MSLTRLDKEIDSLRTDREKVKKCLCKIAPFFVGGKSAHYGMYLLVTLTVCMCVLTEGNLPPEVAVGGVTGGAIFSRRWWGRRWWCGRWCSRCCHFLRVPTFIKKVVNIWT